jgi:zinc/manganese transport system substrate-binding protein
MKYLFAFLIGFFTLSASAQLKIVTTATDFAELAKQIGADKVDVHSVMKGPENVHNVMATPAEMVFLNKADLFVHGGLDSEPWRDNLLKGARNPKVTNDQPGNVDMSQGIELKDTPKGKIDRSQGDVHAYGNPHFQLSPVNAQKMTSTLAKAMAKADPKNADFYLDNAKKYILAIEETSKKIKEEFKPYEGLKVVTFHDAWGYFTDAVPFKVVGTIEPKPLITPSPSQVRDIIDLMKREAVKVVIVETYSDDKLAKQVADQAGAVCIRLPDHVMGVAEASTYVKLFEYDARIIIDAAKRAGIAPKPPEKP